MGGEHACAVREADAFPFVAPVALVAPLAVFAGVAEPGPASELVKEGVVHALELSFGHRELVVVTPALDDRVEGVDEGGLRCPSMLAG